MGTDPVSTPALDRLVDTIQQAFFENRYPSKVVDRLWESARMTVLEQESPFLDALIKDVRKLPMTDDLWQLVMVCDLRYGKSREDLNQRIMHEVEVAAMQILVQDPQIVAYFDSNSSTLEPTGYINNHMQSPAC